MVSNAPEEPQAEEVSVARETLCRQSKGHVCEVTDEIDIPG